MDENMNNTVTDTEEVTDTENTQETTDTSKENSENKETTKDTTKEDKKFTQEEVNSFLRKERLKWEKKNNKQSEAEKFKNMSEDDKTSARLKELEEKLAEYEAEKTHSELLKVTQDTLSESNVSIKFAEFLVSTDAETTKKNVDDFTKLWNKALEKAVNDRLSGKKPLSNNASKPVGSKLTLEEIQKMSVKEAQAHMKEIQEFYKNNSK